MGLWLAAMLGCIVAVSVARSCDGVPPAIMARFHFAEGEKAEKAGQHPKAVEEFEKALTLTKTWPSPETHLAYANSLRLADGAKAYDEARARAVTEAVHNMTSGHDASIRPEDSLPGSRLEDVPPTFQFVLHG